MAPENFFNTGATKILIKIYSLGKKSNINSDQVINT